eukprot:73804-Pleurochrysis_carterae.AAC.3
MSRCNKAYARCASSRRQRTAARLQLTRPHFAVCRAARGGDAQQPRPFRPQSCRESMEPGWVVLMAALVVECLLVLLLLLPMPSNVRCLPSAPNSLRSEKILVSARQEGSYVSKMFDDSLAIVRGVITSWVKGLWNIAGVRYTILAVMALDIFYFLWILDALRSPLYDNWLSPIEMELTCEISMCILLCHQPLGVRCCRAITFCVAEFCCVQGARVRQQGAPDASQCALANRCANGPARRRKAQGILKVAHERLAVELHPMFLSIAWSYDGSGCLHRSLFAIDRELSVHNCSCCQPAASSSPIEWMVPSDNQYHLSTSEIPSIQ